MLTPQTLQKLPDDLVDLVSEVQTDIIKSIAKKLVKADYLTPSAEWQLYKASQLRMSTKEITAMLAKFTGKSKRQIAKLYTASCKEAINNDAKIYRAYGKDCYAALRSVALSNTLKAGIKNANGMTKNLCRSMVESSQATVTHLMDKAWLEVASGAFTPQEAIYNAVSELAAQGIQSVVYPSGHTDWADVAVRRAVMTGISQTAGQMQLDLAAEMDCDLVEVTSHMGARPSHALWQGKVYSISGKSKKYPKLSTATGYGTGAGLKGWNCRHDFYPFFEGISERANLPVDISENNEQYALSQKQRAMERSIRATKRRLAAYDGALADTDDEVLKRKLQNNFERNSAILKTKEKRLSEFCDKNGLYPEKDRVRVVGFGKSVSQKAVRGNKKYLATVAWNAVCTIATAVTTAFGVAINFLTSPIGLVVLAIGALIAIGVLLYKNWETVKQFFIDLWDSFKMTIQQFVDWVTEVWTSIKDFFAGIWQGIKDVFAVVAEWFTGIFQAAWDGILSVWNAVIGWFSDLWTGIKDIFSAVGSWFGDIFTTAWTNIKSAFSATAQFFKDLWTAIKKPFLTVADWFKTTFSKAWEAVKNVFSAGGKIFDGIKDGISGVFTSVVNKLIDGINVIIAKLLEFLNGVLNDIRDIEIAGFTPFDEFWDYDPIPVPQIPKLATGTVVPANYGEFMAILGDNKRETEVVSPLSTIKQGRFVLSYNDDEYVRNLYKDYNIQAVTRNNSLSSGDFKEVIITNF